MPALTKVFMNGTRRKGKRKKQLPLTTGQGIALSLSIAILVALMYVLVHYVYLVPMQRSIEQSQRVLRGVPCCLFCCAVPILFLQQARDLLFEDCDVGRAGVLDIDTAISPDEKGDR